MAMATASGPTVAMAAEVYDGSITDLYIPKKK